MRNPLDIYKQALIYILIFLLCVLAAFLIVGLVFEMAQSISNPEDIVDIRVSVLEYVGEILLVVIIIELIDTILVYWKEHVVRVGAVLLVALTAVARELIVFDYHDGNVQMLMATAVAVIALAASFFLVAKSPKGMDPRGGGVG
jgi:uncharacterized membrane protein (DUF373 family)